MPRHSGCAASPRSTGSGRCARSTIRTAIPSTKRTIRSAPPGGARDIRSNGSARTRRRVTSAMAEQVVIDASVGIAHLHDEVSTVAVDAAWVAWSGAGISLVLPAVFWIEILNSLGTRHRYTAAQAAVYRW